MDISLFKESLSGANPPANVSVYLQALWYDAKGDWDKAHTLIQDIDDKKAAHIHAFLHRKEGDVGNADYWYRRAGARRPEQSLEAEWDALVTSLL